MSAGSPLRPGPEPRPSDALSTFLAILLALFFGGGFLVFLIVVTFNVFLGVIAVAAGVAVFVGLHYLLWGRQKPPDDGQSDGEPGA